MNAKGQGWVRARVEFRVEHGEPLGEYSFYREDGGGRVVSCLCKTRFPKGKKPERDTP